jgi:transposase
MNNLSFHKKPAARQVIEVTGATLVFLAAYRPDLTPSNRYSPS